jgi:hypothetical protein
MVESWAAVVSGLAVLGGMAGIACSWVRATVVDRRIVRMMVACGIDDSIAKKASRNLDIDMDEVRRRCRACPEPETCERFLSGAAVPDNSFCPNAVTFRALAKPEACRVHYDPRHRPGRRLDG